AAVICIALRELARPQPPPRLEIEGEYGVAVAGRRIRVVVARGDVECALLLVDRRCRPDRGSRRPLALRIGRWFRCFRYRKASPKDASGRRVERHNGAAERTADIVRVRRERLFEGRESLI